MVCYHLELQVKNVTEKERVHSFKFTHYPMRMPLDDVSSAAPT